MEEKILLEKDFNILEELKKQNFDGVENFVKINTEYIMAKRNAKDTDSLKHTINYANFLLRYFESNLKREKREYAIYQTGILKGIVSCVAQEIIEKNQKNYIYDSYKSIVYANRHLKEIILALDLHGQMSHKELCEYLALKESTLTEIMKKDVITKFVYFSRLGKYKIYRLTDTGRILGEQLRQHNDTDLRDIIDRAYKKYDNSVEIRPGENIDVYTYDREEVHKQSFKIEAVMQNNDDDDSTVAIKAKKQKYKDDFLHLMKNINVC